MRGTFTLNRAASDDINQVIDKTVEGLNEPDRQRVRTRLKKLHRASQRLVLNFTASTVSVAFDRQGPVTSPANGQTVKWTDADGAPYTVSTRWQGERLEQVFTGENNYRRTNSFSVSADGKTLTVNVLATAPCLAQPCSTSLFIPGQVEDRRLAVRRSGAAWLWRDGGNEKTRSG